MRQAARKGGFFFVLVGALHPLRPVPPRHPDRGRRPSHQHRPSATPPALYAVLFAPPLFRATVRPAHRPSQPRAACAIRRLVCLCVQSSRTRRSTRRPSGPPSVHRTRRLRYTPFGRLLLECPALDRRAVRGTNHTPTRRQRRLVCVERVGACNRPAWCAYRPACVCASSKLSLRWTKRRPSDPSTAHPHAACAIRRSTCIVGGSAPECVQSIVGGLSVVVSGTIKTVIRACAKIRKGLLICGTAFAVCPSAPLIHSVTIDTVSVCNRQMSLKASKRCCRIKKNRGTRSVCGMDSGEW